MSITQTRDQDKRFRFLFGIEPKSLSEFLIISPFFSSRLFSFKLKNRKNFKGRLFRGLNGEYKGQPVSFINTGIGQSLVSDCVLALRDFDIGKKIIFLGACGAIDDLEIGAGVLIENAQIDPEYFNNFVCRNTSLSFEPDFSADKKLASAAGKISGDKIIPIKLMSINSLWDQDNREKFRKMKQDKFQAVDLETAFFYALCSGAPAALSLCYVSDHLFRQPYWSDFSLGQKAEMRRSAEMLVETSLELSLLG